MGFVSQIYIEFLLRMIINMMRLWSD